MSNAKLVKFEEVTPTLLRVVYFDGHLSELISHLNLSIYGAYDGLDEMVFAFLTLPSGRTVTLGKYANSPRTGVDLYVDSKMDSIPSIIYESCQQVGISKSQVVWFRDKFQAEIDQLFAERGSIQEIEKSNKHQKVIYNPIACFKHALRIYDREKFPEYWAMLKYNLGSAYYETFRKSADDLVWTSPFSEELSILSKRCPRLIRAITCYLQSEEVYTLDKYPKRWRISQETLKQVKTLRGEDLSGANFRGADLSEADFSGSNLSNVNFIAVNLSKADLSEANLSGANFSMVYLSDVNFHDSNVVNARFREVFGISDELREDLTQRGAIFEDRPPVESRSIISSHS